jgi:hypothetical protein
MQRPPREKRDWQERRDMQVTGTSVGRAEVSSAGTLKAIGIQQTRCSKRLSSKAAAPKKAEVEVTVKRRAGSSLLNLSLSLDLPITLAAFLGILLGWQEEKGNSQHQVDPDQHYTFHPIRLSIYSYESYNQH